MFGKIAKTCNSNFNNLLIAIVKCCSDMSKKINIFYINKYINEMNVY